ncbi:MULTISPECIES: DUF4062 domain-containing protein [unclassified Methylobacterium]|uniref:DUF4062 domain-containing protein n=1 Tax=unclassified Methylobacterium TaxID=2615210 RepID=UPI00164F6785|nr:MULTISPECIES: DUF4062 domain-containing protein [unclassified Methylobacterium]
MAYQATVIPVMIASPSDVMAERAIVRDVINDWNYVNSQTRSVVLMSTGWETHSAPELGTMTAQELINTRILEHCDLLIGVFWTRLGTPTGKAASGTAEEIQRHIEAGKPALVYFSSAPVVPDSLDQDQYAALRAFKTWCQQRGLTQPFSDTTQFRDLLVKQLGITLNQHEYLRSLIGPSLGEKEPEQSRTREVTISGDCIDLLLAAADDRNGSITRMSALNGVSIFANGKSFVEERDRRSEARWEAALEELENYGLVRDAGHSRSIFQLTASGYKAADQAKAKFADQTMAHENESDATG